MKRSMLLVFGLFLAIAACEQPPAQQEVPEVQEVPTTEPAEPAPTTPAPTTPPSEPMPMDTASPMDDTTQLQRQQ